MASEESFRAFVTGPLERVGRVRSRKMFGKYAIYGDDTVVALVCGDQVFVRAVVDGIADPGAEPSLLIDRLDDAEWFGERTRITAEALPTPTPKKPRHRNPIRTYDSRVNRESWLHERTFDGSRTDPAALVAGRTSTVSVVVPALNVADTIGPICSAIRSRWMNGHSLVDELVVIDSASTDDTAAIATEAGARVVQDAEVLPSVGRGRGKGEAMWKSLAATSGDIILWVDGDIADFDPMFVPKLLDPLFREPRIGFVKAFYERPLGSAAHGGGRVTEICARPLINRFFPDLAGFIQPLSGEVAGRRELLERVPFLTGYAVEMGHLIDILATRGLEGMAQVDLGVRHHANQSTVALGKMAYEITHAVLARVAGEGVVADGLRPYVRPVERDDDYVLERGPVHVGERPPMATVLTGGRS